MVYLPPVFTETRPEILLAHIERHDFAVLVSHGSRGLAASRVPFLLERRAENLFLQAHLARPNPQVADLAEAEEVLVLFEGPHAYISPRWYATGPAVPTWNYADVHAYGRPQLIEDKEWLLAFLRRLSDRHELGAAAPWRIEDQPASYISGMLNGVVGFEIRVNRLEGKFKLSQNRPASDRPRIIAALDASGDPTAAAVAALMRAREPG